MCIYGDMSSMITLTFWTLTETSFFLQTCWTLILQILPPHVPLCKTKYGLVHNNFIDYTAKLKQHDSHQGQSLLDTHPGLPDRIVKSTSYNMLWENNLSNMRDGVWSRYPNTEKSWKYDVQRSIYSEIWGIWIQCSWPNISLECLICLVNWNKN